MGTDESREQNTDEMALLIREHEQLMVIVPVMEGTIDLLADHVIGPKIPDPLRPGEFLINGKGQPMRKPKRRWPRWLGEAMRTAAVVLVSLMTFIATLS